MLPLRRTVLICTVLLNSANIASAFDADPCFAPTIKINEVIKALNADGWKKADRNDPTVVDHVTWMGMPQYFAGDTGGQTVESVLKIKRTSAHGILKKRDLEGAKTRILSRQTAGHTEVVKIAVVVLPQQYASIHCSFSLHAGSIDSWPEFQMTNASGPEFLRLTSDAPNIPDAIASKDVVALNVPALFAKVSIGPPSDAIVETYLSFLSKEKTND